MWWCNVKDSSDLADLVVLALSIGVVVVESCAQAAVRAEATSCTPALATCEVNKAVRERIIHLLMNHFPILDWSNRRTSAMRGSGLFVVVLGAGHRIDEPLQIHLADFRGSCIGCRSNSPHL